MQRHARTQANQPRLATTSNASGSYIGLPLLMTVLASACWVARPCMKASIRLVNIAAALITTAQPHAMAGTMGSPSGEGSQIKVVRNAATTDTAGTPAPIAVTSEAFPASRGDCIGT